MTILFATFPFANHFLSPETAVGILRYIDDGKHCSIFISPTVSMETQYCSSRCGKQTRTHCTSVSHYIILALIILHPGNDVNYYQAVLVIILVILRCSGISIWKIHPQFVGPLVYQQDDCCNCPSCPNSVSGIILLHSRPFLNVSHWLPWGHVDHIFTTDLSDLTMCRMHGWAGTRFT